MKLKLHLIVFLTVVLISCNNNWQQVEKTPMETNVSKSDFIYKDTIEGFKILVKKGLLYGADKMPNALLTVGTIDDTPESKSFYYVINKGLRKGQILDDKFLINFEHLPIENTSIWDMQISEESNGFKKGQAKISSIQKNGNKFYGTIAIYVKERISFQLMILYSSFDYDVQNKMQTKNILDSFEILQ